MKGTDATTQSYGEWVWLFISVCFGLIWIGLQCLPFLNPGDHLWQQELTQYQGNASLFCLSLVLVSSPLGKKLPLLIKDRRYLGLLAYGFAFAHALSAFTHTLGGDWQGWQFLGQTEQIALGLGVLALVLMTVLAITSNSTSVEVLGNAWKQLHRWLLYPVVVLALIHTIAWGVHYRLDTGSGQILSIGLVLIFGAITWLRFANR
jgi:DMSO/TMAO reductase YedYZ heme-binding membrane subunit